MAENKRISASRSYFYDGLFSFPEVEYVECKEVQTGKFPYKPGLKKVVDKELFIDRKVTRTIINVHAFVYHNEKQPMWLGAQRLAVLQKINFLKAHSLLASWACASHVFITLVLLYVISYGVGALTFEVILSAMLVTSSLIILNLIGFYFILEEIVFSCWCVTRLEEETNHCKTVHVYDSFCNIPITWGTKTKLLVDNSTPNDVPEELKRLRDAQGRGRQVQ